MKTLILGCAFSFLVFAAFSKNTHLSYQTSNLKEIDSVKLLVDSNRTYYQKAIRLDDKINASLIDMRLVEFMASKNYQQNYVDDAGTKFIYTTAQTLNTNVDDSDPVDPYTVQFAIVIDIQDHKYRYTVDNVVFFRPTETGDRRLTLYDMHLKATNTDSKRSAKDAKKLIDSFERYLATFTGELQNSIEQKGAIYNSKF